jgi:hypothetical protein
VVGAVGCTPNVKQAISLPLSLTVGTKMTTFTISETLKEE